MRIEDLIVGDSSSRCVQSAQRMRGFSQMHARHSFAHTGA
ncbi:hypothetical protein OKW36_001434 [Paraburkholderia sp. MM5482-R1]